MNIHIRRYSFALLLNKRRIRGLCPLTKHTNRCPEREQIGAPHKHKWTDECEDKYAYSPDDITNPRDIEKTFYEFLKECGITHTGNFEDPPREQPSLLI